MCTVRLIALESASCQAHTRDLGLLSAGLKSCSQELCKRQTGLKAAYLGGPSRRDQAEGGSDPSQRHSAQDARTGEIPTIGQEFS